MRIAIGFKGVHYMNGRHNWYVDFEQQVQNFNDTILTPLKNQGHHVDIFLSSYFFSDEKTALLQKLYSPVSLSFLDFFENEERYSAQYRHHLNLYRNILKYQSDNSVTYDTVITTRFDIEMNKSILSFDYDYSFFNISFKQPCGDVEDCFWVFPGCDLDLVILTLEKMNIDRVTLHKLERYYPKQIRFLVTVEEYSAKPFFNLKRSVRDNQWQY
jgi:hypothetical protein